eukprot:scaffold28323_cov49-Attheya_sp.AAC.2
MDFESFQGHFAMWKYISTRIQAPIPRVLRILPLFFSTWNSLKGGSDTITKLLWYANCPVPFKSPQASAISRMFLLGAVVTHRIFQITSGKKDIEK